MKSIGNFFDRFNSIAIKEVRKRMFVSEIIKKELGIDIPFESISFIGDEIRIKTNPVIRNQIFIKAQKLISIIKKDIGNIKSIG